MVVPGLMHSRPQSLRFFWSRGRRNGGRGEKWREGLYSSVSDRTSKKCLTEASTTLKLGDLELKREQKAVLNVVASKTIARLSEYFTNGFRNVTKLISTCAFSGGPSRKSQGQLCSSWFSSQ